MAVLVVSKKHFLISLEMTQTILTTSGLEQESLRGAEICLFSQEMRFRLIWMRKEVSGWEELFARWICLPAWCASCCKSVFKNLWLMNSLYMCSQQGFLG